jgi:hypothetical protein
MVLWVYQLIQFGKGEDFRVGVTVPTQYLRDCTVRGAGDWCCQFRISTCTVFISESVVSPLLTPVTGARRRQQSLPAECGQLHCLGHSSNPGRGKGNFFWVAHLNSLKSSMT